MYFFFNDTATTEIYTLSLHDALPISVQCMQAMETDTSPGWPSLRVMTRRRTMPHGTSCSFLQATAQALHSMQRDRKSTRLNSSHANISYAVFCLKKKKTILTSCIDQD